MKPLKLFLTLFSLTLLLGACVTTERAELTLEQKLAQKGYALGDPVRSIRDWNLNGWSYVDDQRFVMHSGPRDRYLVTLRSHSMELRHARAIAFTSTVSSVTNKDRVIIEGASDFRETLFIESLHALKRIEPKQDAS